MKNYIIFDRPDQPPLELEKQPSPHSVPAGSYMYSRPENAWYSTNVLMNRRSSYWAEEKEADVPKEYRMWLLLL